MKKIFTLCVVLCLSYLSMGATNPKHEFRATWLTTAWSNDWPKTKVTNATTRKQQQDSLIAIFDRLQAGNMNAVCFQVRGRSDAFYQSSYEPWAAELAGARGTDPGYDPLAFAIEEAHKRGLELHAWVNPFRVTSSGTLSTSDKVWLNAGQWIIQYNNGSFSGQIIDPGYPEAREYVLNVLMEIISNYDIDGIVMDDYFYPYGGTTTEDAASKALHKPANVVDVNKDGKTDDDWRRSNVDVFLKELYDRIQAKKPWVRFGMGTFGIWTTQTKVAQAYGISLPSGISGLDDYDVQACNPVEWVKNGYVDYINPQLYWPTTSTGQNYNKLCQWWAKDVCEHFSNQLTNGKKVHFFSSQSISANPTLTEIQSEIDVNRNNLSSGSTGSVFFDTDAYLTMDKDLMTSRFATNALTPPMDWKSKTALSAPTNLTISGTTLTWQHPTAERFTVYAYPKGIGVNTATSNPQYLQAVVYGKSFNTSSIGSLDDITIAVYTYDRYGVEHGVALYNADPNATDEPEPDPDPESSNAITWELNGGEVNIKTVEVPTNAELWEALKAYYQIFYSEYRADQPITAVSTFMTKACAIMTDAASEYKWLGDYIMSVAAEQGYTLTDDPTADGMEALWRWHVHSFLNCNQRTAWPGSADFSTAGQPSQWGTAYQIAHGAVLLPTYVTSAFTLPIPTHPEGHDFLGWYDNAEFIGSPLTTISADWTGSLYAKWQEDMPTIDPTWQITYTSSNDSIVTPYATDVFGANIVSNTYENGVGTITFDGPVTSIGGLAFYYCHSLNSITIPNSVTSIGNHAFLHTFLSSIAIPNSVTSIGDLAFGQCESLTAVTIPYSVISIGANPFYGCSGLVSIVVEEGNMMYDSRNDCKAIVETATNTLIAGCQNTVIPNNITSIGNYAFVDCTGLTSVTIPNSVTTIENDAFSDCDGLATISIPNSVTSIGDRAFSYCSVLTSITIPNSVTSIGERAFSDCSSLISVTIGNSVTNIGSGAFSGCSSLSSITIPKNVSSIGGVSFSYCESMTSIIVEEGNQVYDSRNNCNAIIETATNKLITGCKSTTIPNRVTSIGNGAFEGCTYLTSITIPQSVTSIGNGAFWGATSLSSITLPNSIKSIGYGAFTFCNSLESITIPSSVISIENEAFSHCPSITSIIVEEDNVNYDSRNNCNAIIETATGTLIAGSNTTVIPNTVKNIGKSAFSDRSISSISIPDSITYIGDECFYGCTHLDTIYIGPIIPPTLGNTLFSNNMSPVFVTPCGTLAAYEASDWANQVGSFVEDCSAKITYELNGGVTNEYGWMSKDDMYHELLVDINAIIPTSRVDVDTVTLAYDKTKNISEGIPTYWLDESLNVLLTNSDFLSKWGWLIDYIEGACASESKWLPSTSARYLRFNLSAFFFEKEYTSWPQTPDYSKYGLYYNFQTAWKHAYTNPTNPTEEFTLNTPYKEGYTFAGWYTNADLSGEKITIVEAETNDTLYAKWIENSLVESTWKVLYTSTNGGIVAPNAIDVFGANIVSNTYENGVGTITFDGPVTSIGTAAFHDCLTLKSITIPNSVNSIGVQAFSDCSAIDSLTIPENVNSISGWAFIDCSSLLSIVVAQENMTYDSRENCNAIIETATNTLIVGCKKTIIPNGVVTIGEHAFRISSLAFITIPNSVTNIERLAFFGSSIDTIYVEATTPPALADSTVFMYTPSPICVIPCGTLAAYEASDWASQVGGFVEDCVEGQQIYYTSTNGNIVTPYATDVFGANIVSNTYENGVGTITFDGPVTTIGDHAFHKCPSLTSITIPNSVTSIGYSTFSFCFSLTSVTIPNSVTSIGDYAFDGCSGLTSITIPNSVTHIGHTAFEDCSSLISLVVEQGNTTYDSRNNCNAIIETATNTLIAGCQNTIIPDNVTSIGVGAFEGCEELHSINIPNNILKIATYAFFGCSKLISITIPNSVTFIGQNAFGNCDALVSITVDSTNSVYDSRDNCNAIIYTAANYLSAGCQNTIIPNSVTEIGSYAFGDCNSLTSIVIPNSVRLIGGCAFYSCKNLTSITIPKSVTAIAYGAFMDCSELNTIHIESTTPPTLVTGAFTSSPTCYIPCGTVAAYEASDWASQVGEFVEEGCAPIQMCGDDLYWEYADGVLTITGTGDMYDYAKDTDVPWYDVRGNIKTVSLPDAMTKIGQNAFYKCTAMTTINMPTSLTAIGEKAFAQDTKLACEIILPASMTTIASRAFFNCQAVTAFHIEATTPPTIPNDAFERTTAPIHVPCGYGHIYGKHTQWGELNLEMCELLQDNVYYYPIDGHTARAVTYHSNPTDTIVIPSAVVIDGMPRTVTEVADFAFADCKDIPAIIFNEGLEYIGERAFVRCYGLHGIIVLPATLETIGERAFSYCDNVEKYLIQAMTPPALGDGAFTCANHDALFYVSCEVMDDYKVAARWSSLKSRLRDACLNIYHYNTPLGANGVHTTEDTLVASIYYRRQFTTSRWETLYLPFEVDRVTVLEDGVEYDLKAWSIFSGGHYYLAKPYGTENKEVVFGFTQVVDAHTPYIIQFKEPYFHDKMITFHGKESWNKLSTSFEALPISFEMQMAGNTTLQDQILDQPVYMLRGTSNFILQNTTTTLHPFECYVMPYATPSGTPARMNVRFRGDVPTTVESVKGNESHLTYTVDGYTLTVYPQGQAFSIYSLNGALLYSCEAGKQMVDYTLDSGFYLLHAGTEAHKIML